MKKIFEDNNIIVYKDDKGFDFAFDIENKNDYSIFIEITEYDEKIKVNNWLGLFYDEKYIVDSIINGCYSIKESEEDL